MSIWTSSIRTIAIAFAGSLMLAANAVAVTFTVDSVLDQIDDDTSDGICHTAAGTCTLRAAVMSANKASGAGATIILPAGTYNLVRPATAADGDDNGDLNFSTPASGNPPITLSGAGAAVTIIDAKGIDRVFNVEVSRTATISGITLRNGVSEILGGGILNAGTLTVSDSVITGNATGERGGGVCNVASGTITINRTTVDGNGTGAIALGGGGLYSEGAMQVNRSTISRNFALYGGGVYAFSGTLFITSSTISLNNANTDGGGIYNSATTNIYSSTIVGNQADADVDENGGSGGGVFNDAFRTLNARNTIIAGNYVSESPIGDDCTGTFGTYGIDVLGVSDGCVFPNSDATFEAIGYGESLAQLGPLQNNGGPTETIALVASSSIIDLSYYDLVGLGCIDQNGDTLPTDQRGLPRAVHGYCDIGAFEYQEIIFANGFD